MKQRTAEGFLTAPHSLREGLGGCISRVEHQHTATTLREGAERYASFHSHPARVHYLGGHTKGSK
jgi:hypothetical protein